MNPGTILATLHNTPARTWRAAAVASATTFFLAGSLAGAVLPPNPAVERKTRADWPACTLFTEMARDALKAQGHSVIYRPIGARGGFYWLDGTHIGNASAENAPFIACGTERVIAPIRKVPRY